MCHKTVIAVTVVVDRRRQRTVQVGVGAPAMVCPRRRADNHIFAGLLLPLARRRLLLLCCLGRALVKQPG